MSKLIKPNRKILSMFSLVMINVIAVDSLRTVPISAKLGLSLITYYLIAAIIFFIPIGLVAAELATAYPNAGGIYIWVREAFGKRAGFIAIWLQWIYNVVWYPTIMVFIVTMISYFFDPALAKNKVYLLPIALILFWLFTILNCLGLRVSNIVSICGALIGTIFPMLVIIILGIIWIFTQDNLILTQTYLWIPDFSDIGNLSLFTVVLFGLIGLEMSAVHAEEVRHPQRDYPRAIMYSTLIIFSTLVCSALAIVLVIPAHKLSIVSGLIDAYVIFFKTFHLSWMMPILIALIILGSLSSVSTWILGPTTGLLVAAKDGALPLFFTKINKHGAPFIILIIQGIIFSILISVFILFDSINTAYWLLSDLSAQMALIVYIFMFSAAIKLRYTQPHKPRYYRISGNNSMMWLIAGSGIMCCLIAIIIGFVPPTQILINNTLFFEVFLISGLIIFTTLPLLLIK